MGNMFNSCEKLTELDLSVFDTSNVILMDKMFCGCSSLTELNLSSFNTEKVESMAVMFSGCSSLTELDLSNFRTDSVLTMESMFAGCFSLTELNISGFNMSIRYDINVQNMFGLISAETEIYVSSDTEQFLRIIQGEKGEHYLGNTGLNFVVV
jgi:surface protein